MTATNGGLLDWTLEYLISRLKDKDAAGRTREIVELRAGLLVAAERDLPRQGVQEV